MSKGLEALKKIQDELYGHYDFKDISDYSKEQLEIIEKELKEAEEDKEVLEIFKNALTIEHHEPMLIEHNDSEDVISYTVRTLFTIKQQELDKSLRKALREWVLKNAFPKELKALEIIRNIGILKPYETIGGKCWLETMCDATKITKDNYDLLKEVLL